MVTACASRRQPTPRAYWAQLVRVRDRLIIVRPGRTSPLAPRAPTGSGPQICRIGSNPSKNAIRTHKQLKHFTSEPPLQCHPEVTVPLGHRVLDKHSGITRYLLGRQVRGPPIVSSADGAGLGELCQTC